MSFRVPEQFRVRKGPLATDASDGNNGGFWIPNRVGRTDAPFTVVASDGGGWEHVSVSLPMRCPTWQEMTWIKALFWGPEDCVVQFHPAESQYVNNHPHCLHLWRPTGVALPVPPSLMVGFQQISPAQIAAMTEEQKLQAMDMAADLLAQQLGR